MVYSTIPLESTSRSSLDLPIQHTVSSAPQSILLPQQQQQQQQQHHHHHLFYPTFGSISSSYSPSNPPPNFQNSLDPRRHSITTANAASSTLLRNHEYRGLQKNSKWQTKHSRATRPKDHVAMQNIQQQQQHQLPQYAPAPLVLYDPVHLAAAPPPPPHPHPQVYLAQSSYNQPAYLPDGHYGASTTSYYKPPDLSTFCLIPERQNPQTQYAQQPLQQQQPSYYNVKSRFHFSTLTSYPPHSNLATTESQFPQKIMNNTFFDNSVKADAKKFKDIKKISPIVDDKLMDESPNYNFTIEAEKMVSELCNTSSYEYDKDEDENIEAASSSLKISSQEVKAETSTETSATLLDGIQSTDLIRKSIYWACNAADNLLNNSSSSSTTNNNRKSTLFNLSTATKIALGKSSTCLPIYSGDEIFSEDLINAVLRISNGWLILDHYLNKQHPAIEEKCDKDLINSFRNWEKIMPDFLDNLVKTFIKVGSNSSSSVNSMSSSVLIPGDVSLYMNSGMFGNLPAASQQQVTTKNSLYPAVKSHEQKYHWSSSVGRESKLKSKWTITENTKTTTDLLCSDRQCNLICSNNNSRPPENIPNRMTLLSQIETKTSTKDTITTTGEESGTINLSAWFASVKNKQQPWSRDTLKSSVELGLKMDVNRQLRTLKNMRTIQSAPWTANYILDDGNIDSSKGPDDFRNNSDELRGYMKPGSYNVPKKKYQSNRAGRSRNDSSSGLCPPAAEQVPQPDVAWKAACASAEIFLGAMSVQKDSSDLATNPHENEKDKIDENKDEEEEEENYFTPQWKCKEFDKSEGGASSSSEESEEAEEEEESGAIPDDGNKKSHVKTDSWLIKTLNNASHGIKNNKVDEDKSVCIETSRMISVMTIDVVGKATYSETVRRLPSKSKIISPIPHAVEKTRDESVHQSMSSSLEESRVVKNHDSPVASSSVVKSERGGGKSKKGKNHQPGEKGWSVWYSSRRKQNANSCTLGPIAVEKLTSIHRTLWKMDSTRLFKYPSSNSSKNIEKYRKVVKSPVFLDTIGYKLKNHVYRKVEDAIKDLRKIVCNSRIYHKNEKDSVEKVEALSRKLEQLLNQYFPDKNCPNASDDEEKKSSSPASCRRRRPAGITPQ